MINEYEMVPWFVEPLDQAIIRTSLAYASIMPAEVKGDLGRVQEYMRGMPPVVQRHVRVCDAVSAVSDSARPALMRQLERNDHVVWKPRVEVRP